MARSFKSSPTFLPILTTLLVTLLIGCIILGLVITITAGWNPELPAGYRKWLIFAKPFAPYSTALVAAIASGIALMSYHQKRESDSRAEWWRRTQYAISLALTDGSQMGQTTGIRMLEYLRFEDSKLRADEALLVEVVNGIIQDFISLEKAVPNNKESENEEDHTEIN